MSNSVLVVNADGPEIRVALIEDGLLGELFVERKRDRGIAGNIYKGKVERILPGMQAAFVNIGLEKSAYLHVSDVRGTPDDLRRLLSGDSGPRDSAEANGDDAGDEPNEKGGGDRRGGVPGNGQGRRIEELLKPGQEIIVQVTKEPISTKGARVTRYISLPGRHLVFMPTVDHVGISRRINSDRERRRLRRLVNEMRPQGSGFIVRTVASGVADKDLRADMAFLIKMWNEVVKKTETSRCPSLIYSDLDLLLRSVRDLFTADVEKMIIDSKSEYERVKKFIAAFMPDFPGEIEFYNSNEPIFDGLGIEMEIDKALERKVWLKSGGYLIIDEMEALTAVDVNTGRFVGKKSLEDTITQTNLEAAREVADQLRVRSLGGMIVVDFIDMDRASNREKVMRVFNDALKRDRNRAQVTRISELGLVEMSRKRTRESLLHTLTEQCLHCEGKGFTRSRQTVSFEVLRELRRQGNLVDGHTILVEVHPDVAKQLTTVDRDFLEDIEKRLQKQILVKTRGSFHMEEFEIRSPKDKQKIERSEVATSSDKLEERKRRRFRRVLSPDELANLDNDEGVVNAEFMTDDADDEAKPSYDHAGREVQHELDEMDLAYAAASQEDDEATGTSDEPGTTTDPDAELPHAHSAALISQVDSEVPDTDD
ncbi:MAG: Rne/Rng family ribonuclease [Deltaproteobacteria bacterium]|nr:Rne/Rng family ribonuclease [Deltaproteobacteria bacterium]